MNQEAQNTMISLNTPPPQSIKDYIDEQVARLGYSETDSSAVSVAPPWQQISALTGDVKLTT